MPRFILPACLLAFLLFAGCKSAGLTPHEGGVSAGRPDFNLRVPPGFRLLAAGNDSAGVPADISAGPQSRFSYSQYVGGPESPGALLHVLVADLPAPAWRFAEESERAPQDFDFSKEKRGGRFLTLRTRILGCEDDWFCALAAQNNGKSAQVMLARRISFTPDIHTRVVLEYRETAPACLRALAAEAPAGNILWVEHPAGRPCAEDLDAFTRRADAALVLGAPENSAPAAVPVFTPPAFEPDMELLCGTAEHVDRDDPDYRNR